MHGRVKLFFTTKISNNIYKDFFTSNSERIIIQSLKRIALFFSTNLYISHSMFCVFILMLQINLYFPKYSDLPYSKRISYITMVILRN